ncbi:MAG TPA: nucleotidyltransferase family protein, partial [Dongiaceae bacterium]|nr:nucleotidyltransferase family protein [Dongiaceae bacterium]
MPPDSRSNLFRRPSPGEQQELLAALRGGDPGGAIEVARLDLLLRHYECGGWLHARRSAPGARALPEPWRQAAARAHRKTVVDSLVALGVGGEVTALLTAARIPVILLKGASYLGELYDDPGERPLVDLDLLVAPRDVAAVAARLKQAGFAVLETHESPHVAEYRRFEMARPGPAPCRVEVHWQLGTGGRMHFDQEAIRARARRAAIQGVACLALEPHDAVLYHVGHAREHYFGPSLKWALDLRA